MRRHEKRTHPYQRVTDRGQFEPRFTAVCSVCVDTCMQDKRTKNKCVQCQSRCLCGARGTGFKKLHMKHAQIHNRFLFFVLNLFINGQLFRLFVQLGRASEMTFDNHRFFYGLGAKMAAGTEALGRSSELVFGERHSGRISCA